MAAGALARRAEMELFLRLQARRHRRCLAHQSDGHAPIGRHEGVVGKQRIGVGLAGHGIKIGRRQPGLFQDLRTEFARSTDRFHGP